MDKCEKDSYGVWSSHIPQTLWKVLKKSQNSKFCSHFSRLVTTSSCVVYSNVRLVTCLIRETFVMERLFTFVKFSKYSLAAYFELPRASFWSEILWGPVFINSCQVLLANSNIPRDLTNSCIPSRSSMKTFKTFYKSVQANLYKDIRWFSFSFPDHVYLHFVYKQHSAELAIFTFPLVQLLIKFGRVFLKRFQVVAFSSSLSFDLFVSIKWSSIKCPALRV